MSKSADESLFDERGMHIATHDCDCAMCKVDLYFSAVVSPDRPGCAVCLQHWTALAVPPERCVLLTR